MHLDQTPKKAGTEKKSRCPFKNSSNKNLVKEGFFFLWFESCLNSPSSFRTAFDVESIWRRSALMKKLKSKQFLHPNLEIRLPI